MGFNSAFKGLNTIAVKISSLEYQEVHQDTLFSAHLYGQTEFWNLISVPC